MNKFKKLAKCLDKIPNGFPASKSGVELQLLEKLFSPEEAKIACNLKLEARTARVISAEINKNERDVFIILKSMVKKGLIDAERGAGGLAFRLMPFVVGFYERQNAKIDKEFAHLFEKYYQEVFYKMMTLKPSVHRVIPVETTIPVNMEVMPYEKASFYVNQASSWGVLKCICRVQKDLIDQRCHHSKENCLVLSKRAKAFDRTPDIRAITREESLLILDQSQKEGLVHSIGNKQDGIDYICNCCSCCCGVLQGVVKYGELNSVASSDFYAEVDINKCTGCKKCLASCQFSALCIDTSSMGTKVKVDLNKCLGCGLCIKVCKDDSLSLVMKSESEIEAPPLNESAWQNLRIKARK